MTGDQMWTKQPTWHRSPAHHPLSFASRWGRVLQWCGPHPCPHLQSHCLPSYCTCGLPAPWKTIRVKTACLQFWAMCLLWITADFFCLKIHFLFVKTVPCGLKYFCVFLRYAKCRDLMVLIKSICWESQELWCYQVCCFYAENHQRLPAKAISLLQVQA